MPGGEKQELVEFRTSGFFVSFPVVSEGKPECHKQDANDGDCGYPPAKGSPVELEPGGSSGLVNVFEVIAIGLDVMVDGRLLR